MNYINSVVVVVPNKKNNTNTYLIFYLALITLGIQEFIRMEIKEIGFESQCIKIILEVT